MTLCAKDTEACMYKFIVRSKVPPGSNTRKISRSSRKKAHPDSTRYLVMVVDYWYKPNIARARAKIY